MTLMPMMVMMMMMIMVMMVMMKMTAFSSVSQKAGSMMKPPASRARHLPSFCRHQPWVRVSAGMPLGGSVFCSRQCAGENEKFANFRSAMNL